MLKSGIFVAGRRGKTSLVDGLLMLLSRQNADRPWPKMSFPDLAERLAVIRQQPVARSSVRSAVYGHSALFERLGKGKTSVIWQLSAEGRNAAAKLRQ
jgi:hypothetical protein